MHHSTWRPHPQPPFGYVQPHGDASCFAMGFLCCRLMRRTNQNYLHLQSSHWICIGRISKKIPRTYRKGCTTTHTNALEMRAKHACNSYKCITRLIVTGTRHYYVSWAWPCTNFVHSAPQSAPMGKWTPKVLSSNTHQSWSYVLPQLLPYIHHSQGKPILFFKKKKECQEKRRVNRGWFLQTVAHRGYLQIANCYQGLQGPLPSICGPWRRPSTRRRVSSNEQEQQQYTIRQQQHTPQHNKNSTTQQQ